MDTQRPPTFSAERESANSLISSVPDETRVMEPVVRQGLGVILRQYPLQLLMVGTLLVLTATGTIYATISQKDAENNSSLGIQPSSKFSVQDVTLNGVLRPDTLNLNTIQSLSINGQLRANNSLILAPTTQPTGSNATVGQVYFDRTDNALAYYNGTQFISVAGTNDLDALRSQIAAVNTRVSAIPPVQPIPTAVSIPSDLATLGASNSFTSANNFTAGLTASSLAANTLMTTGNTSLQGSLTVAGSTILGPTTAASLVLASPLTVSSGGTGASSLSADGVVLANGSGPLSTADYTSGGQCLMSPLSGAGAPVFGVCPGGVGSGVNQLNSLIGNVTLANATGVGTTITIDNASTTTKGIASFNTSNFSVTAGVVNTIQNIGITASPTFAGLTANNLTSIPNQNLTLNASGTGNLYLTGYDCSASGGGGKLTVDATGQVMCAADGDTDTTGITTITAGNGITITGVNNTIAASVRTGFGVQIDSSGIGLADSCLTNEILKRTAGGWACATDTVGTGDGVGATTVGALDGGTANANGATITGTSLFLQSATATNPGLINTGIQTFAGAKTFNGAVALAGGATATGNFTASGTVNGATISGGTLSAGSFTGGSVSGGTLSAAAVNGLTLSGTALTGSGALVVASATNTNLTLNAAGTGNLYLTGYDCSASGGGGKLTVDATGQVVCGADGAGSGVSLSGSATDGSLAKFNASGQIMNSNLAESGITNKALTYTGNAIINANTGFTGNLLDLKLNNVSKFSVTETGVLAAAGVIRSNTGFSYNGTSGATTSCSGGQFLQNQVVQGGIVTGGTCATAGGLQGSGTNGQIGVFDVNGALQGSANMLFDGSTASLTLGSSTLIGSLLFHDGTGFKGTIRIASGGLSQNTIYVLPAVSGGVVEICTSAGNCIRNGNLAGDMLYWDGDSWELITNGINGQSLIFCGNTPKWGSGGCPATITTTAASSVLDNSASTGGNVTSDGGTAVTERGIVYSTTSNPTTANSKVISGSGTGTFTVNLTGLTHSTTYYVRAYAINTNGTAYGNQISFTTMVGYAIGDTGPAGGKIFYDKGSYSSGWRYLESSLSDQGTTYPWGGDIASIPGADGLVIGTGNQNTIDAYTYCSATGCNIYAPQTAYNLVLNGFSDWFLPSRDELNQMYIQRNIIGGFQATSYWSSSECGSYSACSQSFITGAQYSTQEKIDYLRMRAIRAF